VDWQTWTAEASPDLNAGRGFLRMSQPFWLYSFWFDRPAQGGLSTCTARFLSPAANTRSRSWELGDSGHLLFSRQAVFTPTAWGNGMNFPIFVGASTVLWHGSNLAGGTFLNLSSRFHPTVFFGHPSVVCPHARGRKEIRPEFAALLCFSR